MNDKVEELIEARAELALQEIAYMASVARRVIKIRLDFFKRSQRQQRRREAEREARR